MKERAVAFTLAFICATLAMAFAGCGSPSPIIMEQFGGVSDIPEGEEAFIYWTFANADYVLVDGQDKRYAISDRMITRPPATTSYRVTAKRDNDSLAQEWTVNVYRSAKKQQNSDPAGGERFASSTVAPASSGYFRGGNTSLGTKPAHIKVISFTPFSLDETEFHVKSLVYDSNGLFIPGKIREASEGEWYGRYSCGEVSEEHKVTSIVERSGDVPLPAIAIALDRSFGMAEFGTAPFQAIRSYLSELPANSSVSFSTFNQNNAQQIPLIGADAASITADFLTAPAAEGLSATYRAADYALKSIENVYNKNKVVILITAGTDNASTLFTVEDVVARARNAKVPIYVIALGEAPQLYDLRYLVMKTGGRLYQTATGNMTEISAVLKEIAEGQMYYYDINLPAPGNTQSCEVVTSLIVLPSDGSSFSDKITIYDRRRADAPMYQSIALFYDDNTVVPEEYKDNIKQIAAVLKANPNKKIELSGHSSLANSDADAIALANQRTQAVKRIFTAAGIEDNRIHIRNMSNRKPAYYFEDTKWQTISNCRVDIRWLDPALLPYEIAAQRVSSEDEALQFTEEWERRGIKSYYERAMVKHTPMYIVKLWGYGTAEEAENAAKILAKQYKVDLRPE
ncbi:hypothetical protein MASR2M18_08100 [Ignavibacteria bacterium]|nr:OmpA family protein [Bacteroidota bacterium]MCZ2132941.1 OmpA family protein [Bacteroidota bacterium]